MNAKWKPYVVEFSSPDGEFVFVIHAISSEHAILQIDALKETARLLGELDQKIGPPNE